MMKREIHDNLTEAEWLEMRARDLTSTEVGALFGVSPYETKFELWHRKAGNIPSSFQENERTIIGQEIEPVIARAIGRSLGIQVREHKSYIRIPELRLGASFDWEWLDGETGEWVNLEIKNLDFLVFRDQWKLWDGGVEPPLHIELQQQIQALMRDQDRGSIGYMVGGTSIAKLDRPAHPATIEKIKRAALEFWASIDAGREPDPDFERDGDVLKALYAKPDPRATLAEEAQAGAMDAVAKACAAAEEKKAAEKREATQKAILTRIMKDAPEALLPDGSRILFRADKNGRRAMRLTPAGANSSSGKEARQ